MDFSQIAILFVFAGLFGTFARLIKQPIFVGFLLAGIFLGLTGLVKDSNSLKGFSQIGVALLLFLLGLEMNIRELPTVGKTVILVSLGQILATFSVGMVLLFIFGFSWISSLYIAIAFTFSSTIIIVKILSEKKDLRSLSGRIAIGILLIQDFIAILILMFLASGKGSDITLQNYLFLGLKAVLLFTGVWWLSKKILPIFFEKLFASSTELMFIGSLAWVLGVSSLISGPLGFSLEIGGLLAGISLSNLPEHLQIASKTKPIRDFFLTIFFLFLGTQIIIGKNLLEIIFPVIFFSLFVLFGKAILVFLILCFLGYKKRTSFFVGLMLSQISEFSFVLVSMGNSLGQIGNKETSIVVMVGVISMTVSSYFMYSSENIFNKVKNILKIFEREKTVEKGFLIQSEMKEHIVLVGCDRTGRTLIQNFMKKNTPFLVVDFNPKVFNQLTSEGVPVIFGDINDPDILDAANVSDSKMLISTIANLSDNMILLTNLKRMERTPITVLTVNTKDEAIKLYKAGANFVIVPEVVAGDFIKNLIRIHGTKTLKWISAGKGHFNRLIAK